MAENMKSNSLGASSIAESILLGAFGIRQFSLIDCHPSSLLSQTIPRPSASLVWLRLTQHLSVKFCFNLRIGFQLVRYANEVTSNAYR